MRYITVFCLVIMMAMPAQSAQTNARNEWVVVATDLAVHEPEREKFIGGVTNEKAPTGQSGGLADGLPDGLIAVSRKGDIRKAWYILPTRRYGHGIMGDAIEAGGLYVETAKGEVLTLVLPDHFVFEDRYPRLADLDGDGTTEIITLLSGQKTGAAIALYRLANGKIVKGPQTPPIGKANRWRNIAGIADYNGDGRLDIMEVATPHGAGVLSLWHYDKAKGLERQKSVAGFANHFIGSRALELSASIDIDGDGLDDLAIPDSDRTTLHLLSGKTLAPIARIPLPAKVSGNIETATTKGKLLFLLPGKGGKTMLVTQK